MQTLAGLQSQVNVGSYFEGAKLVLGHNLVIVVVSTSIVAKGMIIARGQIAS
jgi:hypothetical protein